MPQTADRDLENGAWEIRVAHNICCICTIFPYVLFCESAAVLDLETRNFFKIESVPYTLKYQPKLPSVHNEMCEWMPTRYFVQSFMTPDHRYHQKTQVHARFTSKNVYSKLTNRCFEAHFLPVPPVFGPCILSTAPVCPLLDQSFNPARKNEPPPFCPSSCPDGRAGPQRIVVHTFEGWSLPMVFHVLSGEIFMYDWFPFKELRNLDQSINNQLFQNVSDFCYQQ